MREKSLLRLLAGALAGVLIVGTIGYRLLMDWGWVESLTMAVITLSTVGFGGVHQMDTAGRFFTIFLVMADVGNKLVIRLRYNVIQRNVPGNRVLLEGVEQSVAA